MPDTLCEEGPYKHIRHPLYVSYIIAFAAAAVAYPRPASAAILIFNVVLFTHAAITDERSLAKSDLADAYAAYRTRTGVFIPRLKQR